MEAIETKAQELGQAIAASERCRALKAAAQALEADAAAKQLEQDYAAAAQVLHSKAGAGQPIEPEEKRREAELRSQMARNEVIRNFLRAQADFTELMQKVNAALERAIDLR